MFCLGAFDWPEFLVNPHDGACWTTLNRFARAYVVHCVIDNRQVVLDAHNAWRVRCASPTTVAGHFAFRFGGLAVLQAFARDPQSMTDWMD